MNKALLLLAAAIAAHAQTGPEPIPIHACAVLNGHAKGGSPPDDTTRIQSALDLCSPGGAVVLHDGSFLSHSLLLPRGVTLFVGRGVILSGEGPWDLPPGRGAATHKPFIFSYQAAFSGVMGEGVIQGNAPELVSSYESQGFRLSGVTLRDAKGTAAAIYKTTGFRSEGLKIDAGPSGMLLSNAVDAKVSYGWIRVTGDGISLRSSILGPTTNVDLRDVHFFGGNGVVKGTGDAGRLNNITMENVATEPVASPAFATAPALAYALDLDHLPRPATWRSQTVSPGESIQAAIDALPLTGGDVTVKPGTYREVVTIRKPHVRLHGEDPDPSKTVIVFNHGPSNGGTFASGTVFVEAPDVTIDHLTIANDLGNHGQAVALAVTADRAIFRNLRIVGAQDTLFAASRYCYGDYGPCEPARQYFADSYIQGNTDFIFGDSLAVFENCEIHGIQGNVMYTAQSRHTAEQTESAYVFDHCRFTGAPREQGIISFGRPWRPYATVVLLHAQIDAPVIPAGWTEWPRFGKPSLPTAYYAEFESTGPGASPETREKYSHQLTAAEAQHWQPALLLAGKDHWNPRQ